MTSLALIWFGAFLAVWSLWRYMSNVWVSAGARGCKPPALALLFTLHRCARCNAHELQASSLNILILCYCIGAMLLSRLTSYCGMKTAPSSYSGTRMSGPSAFAGALHISQWTSGAQPPQVGPLSPQLPTESAVPWR